MRVRPVTVRASRTAASTASEPVLVNAARSAPVISQSSAATLPASGRLRTDLDAALELFFERRRDERGRVPEQIRAEAHRQIDVLVAVDVPEPRTRRSARRRSGKPLPSSTAGSRKRCAGRTKCARVSCVRPLRAGRARGVAGDERVEVRLLPLGEPAARRPFRWGGKGRTPWVRLSAAGASESETVAPGEAAARRNESGAATADAACRPRSISSCCAITRSCSWMTRSRVPALAGARQHRRRSGAGGLRLGRGRRPARRPAVGLARVPERPAATARRDDPPACPSWNNLPAIDGTSP